MYTDVRTVESADCAEIYITATPSPGLSAHRQAEEVFAAIGEVLRATDGRLVAERVFAGEAVMPAVASIRAQAYGDLDDRVAPSRLAVANSLVGELSGVQVHAIRGAKPVPLRWGDVGCGRLVRTDAGDYMTLSGLSAVEAGPDPATQTRAVFEKALAVLKPLGADMHAVARTWLWLSDILSWYGDFNRVRNRFYTEQGLLDGRSPVSRPPASTGIGIRPAGGPRCALDLIAIAGNAGALCHHAAAGNQNSPHVYGSAFSRVSQAITPAGKTVFVSGTAAIDAQGQSLHGGNAAAQIEQTMENARAVLKDMNCSDRDVVHALAYSRDVEVERLFRATHGDLPWPCLSVLADICRDELVFEIEVTACPGARKL